MTRLVAFASAVALLWWPGIASAQAQTLHRVYVVRNAVQGLQWVMHLYEGLLQDGRLVSLEGRTTVDGRSAYSLFSPGQGEIAVLAGGDVVAWRGYETRDGQNLILYNRRSDTLTLLPGLDHVGVADPVRPRLFASYQGRLASISESGVQGLPGTEGLLPRTLSPDGARLYAVRSDWNVNRVTVVDTSTGATLEEKVLPRTYLRVTEIVVSPDGSRMWLVVTEGGAPSIVGIDLATGAEALAIPLQSPYSQTTPSGMALDSAGRLVVSLFERPQVIYPTSSGSIRVFDATTGAPLNTVTVPGRSHLRVDAPANVALTLSYAEYWLGHSDGCFPTFIAALATVAGATPVVSPVGDLGCAVAAFSENVSAAPRPPSLHAPSVGANRTVSLTWTPPAGSVSGYLVDAGSAPGLTDIGTIPTTAASLVVPGVPPGTYYVRVRAQNADGTSLPSNERRLDVAGPPSSPPVLDPPLVTADSSVTLSWTRPTGATGFLVEAGTAAGLADIATLAVGDVDRITLPGVPDGRYVVRVRATSAGGAGPPSNDVLVQVPAPPAAPVFNAPVVGAGGTVTLSWQSPAGVVTGFVIEVGNAPGLANLTTLTLPIVNTLTVPGVPGGSYFVRVRALNRQSAGPPSGERRVDVSAASPRPASPGVPPR